MTRPRLLVIVNPAAGQGRAAAIAPELPRMFEAAGADAQVVLSTSSADTRERARTTTGIDAVIAVGGDGTTHDALNGVVRREDACRVALGVLPSGSADDWAHNLGMPKDPSAAVRALVEAPRTLLDLGRANDEYFVNSISIGFDALVTDRAKRVALRTGLRGRALYVRALAEALFRDYGPVRLRVSIDDAPVEDMRVILLLAAVSPTYGGGIEIVPHADRHDGLLDVLSVDAMPLISALPKVPVVLRGEHERLKQAHMSRATRLRVEAETPMVAQIDGELARSTCFEIESVPDGVLAISPENEAGPA